MMLYHVMYHLYFLRVRLLWLFFIIQTKKNLSEEFWNSCASLIGYITLLGIIENFGESVEEWVGKLWVLLMEILMPRLI